MDNIFVFEQNALNEHESASVYGGRSCTCACYYRYNGGSGTDDNAQANYAGGPNGLVSPQKTQDEEVLVDRPDGGIEEF